MHDSDYLPVAMPTTDLQVLYVLTGRPGVLRRHSTINTALKAGPGSTLPTVISEAVVADSSGSMTRSTKVGLGLSAVTTIARALGASGEVRLSANGAHTIQYGYSDVSADRVDLADLDRWLGAADFDPAARSTADLLAADTCHVVVAVLKAKALDVTVLDEHGGAVALDVSAVQQAVDVEVGAAVASRTSDTLTFRGTSPLAIGAKVITIKVDENGFAISNRRIDGRTEIRGGLGGYTYLREPELRFEPR